MFFAFLLSMLGGYPIGARLINEMYKQNAIEIFRATSQTAPLREIQPDGSRQP